MGLWDIPAKHEIGDTELRFNPYHDPTTGRFTTANGGGGGFLYVGKGQKGKGAYVFNTEKSKPTVEKITINGTEREVYSTAPKGFRRDANASSGVNGLDIYTNGKSRFGGERKTVYVKNEYFKNESAQSLVDKARENRQRKAEHNEYVRTHRYDRPQQSSASSKRLNNRLHSQLSSWL